MSDYTTVEFCGLTRHDNSEMNSDVAAKYGAEKENGVVKTTSLTEAVGLLDPVELADLFVENPYTGEQHKLDMANATINPVTTINMAQDSGPDAEDMDGDDFTYAVHSGNYAEVSHYDFLSPMTRALADAEIHNVAGQFRIYDNGAQVHGEVVLQEHEEQLQMDGNDDPLFVGISVGNSYDGSCSMYAMGYAMDTFCNNSMRNLTDKRSRKHVGDPAETQEWWGSIIEQMSDLRDILGDVIEQALDVEMDFLDQPFSIEEFYELLGLPGYLARAAATTARNRSPREGGTRSTLNFWTLHSGLTSALTHDFSGSSEVGSLETYSRIAKDILWNPANIMAEVKNEYERQQQMEAQTDEEQETVAENVASIERYERSLDDRKEEFEQFEDEIAGVLEVSE
jgi:hypothetical protein